MIKKIIHSLNAPETRQFLLQRSPAIISLILIVACAHILAQITWMLFSQPETEQITIINAKPAVVTANTDKQQAFRKLTSAHLFGTITNETPKTQIAPKTQLNLILRGVLAAQPDRMASAIISRGNSGAEDIYGINDRMPDGVIIREIHADYVILDRSGSRETLYLIKDEELGEMIYEQPASDNYSQDVIEDPSQSLQNVREKILSNPALVSEYVTPRPVSEDGKLIGFTLQAKNDNELLTQIGIEPDDIITSVNGIALDDPKNSLAAIRNLSTADELSITILRNGTEMPLNIQLK